MFLTALIKKAATLSIIAVAGFSFASDYNSGEETVVMVKTQSGYMCSDVISLKENQKPQLSELNIGSCELKTDVPIGVNIITL